VSGPAGQREHEARNEPFAVVFTYVPSTEECFHTPFSGEHHDDPLSFAHRFREAEEERGDFPGSLWSVTGNAAAKEIRSEALMRSLGVKP
jgi:hypothetical protein